MAMLALAILLLSTACRPFLGAYIPQPADSIRVHRDIAYVDDGDPKHRLDLFVPYGAGFPIVLFAHGGGWKRGDKALTFFGRDFYHNAGRYFAARGMALAVVNYRLQPRVRLADQIADVAAAIMWLHQHALNYGGDPRALFVSGHSAGGQLVAHVAYDARHLNRYGVGPEIICGVAIISGGALDIDVAEASDLSLDTEDLRAARQGAHGQTPLRGLDRVRARAMSSVLGTWSQLRRLFDPRYFETRFDDQTPGWRRTASPTSYVSASAPPTLILNAENDLPSLRLQGARLYQRLTDHQVLARYEIIPDEHHLSLINALSRDSALTAALAQFVRALSSPSCMR